ncbi:MAG: RNA polymerase sigma factor [Odoribacteraceae bacterium]|jgi:RNA polymerase sigma-70 factor (ECF subfamily)|nr:RNA polymerase sigma factor [Odoribacteraceae bacterium]
MNREEYNRAVERFSDDVYRFIYKMCRSREMAEDVVQDSYLRLWETLSSVSFEKVKAFLFTVAYRRAVDILRREKRFKEVESLEAHGGTDSTRGTGLQEALETALERLPAVQRTVVLLRDYEEYSYKEIAAITGLGEAQVKVYIFRARVAMRAFLGSPDKVI